MSVFPTLDFIQIQARYPKAVNKIIDWLFKQEELKNMTKDFVDPSNPEESKVQFAGLLIQMDPRKLYDIFDSFGIHITISYGEHSDSWIFYNNHQQHSHTSSTRIQAEQTAFHDAFEILETLNNIN